MSLVTDIAGGGAGAPVDVALLWNGGAETDGVAFWELGQTVGRPVPQHRDRRRRPAIAAVLPVPQHPALRVLQTASAQEFYVLDLQTRTAAPLVTSTAAIALSMSPVGDQVWTFVPSGTNVAATGILDTHPRSLIIERPVRHVFEVANDEGLFAMIVHSEGQRRGDNLQREHTRRRDTPPLLRRPDGGALPMKRQRQRQRHLAKHLGLVGMVCFGIVALSAPAPAAAQMIQRVAAKPKAETWQAAAGLRTMLVRSAGYDPFSGDDVLAQFSLGIEHMVLRSDAFVFAAGIGGTMDGTAARRAGHPASCRSGGSPSSRRGAISRGNAATDSSASRPAGSGWPRR